MNKAAIEFKPRFLLGVNNPSDVTKSIESSKAIENDEPDSYIVISHHDIYDPVPLSQDEISYFQLCNYKYCSKPCSVMKPLISSDVELQSPTCEEHGIMDGPFYPKVSTFIQYFAFYRYEFTQSISWSVPDEAFDEILESQ